MVHNSLLKYLHLNKKKLKILVIEIKEKSKTMNIQKTYLSNIFLTINTSKNSCQYYESNFISVSDLWSFKSYDAKFYEKCKINLVDLFKIVNGPVHILTSQIVKVKYISDASY